MSLKVDVVQKDTGIWQKNIEGRDWQGGDEVKEAFIAEVRKCPKCETRCTYIDDETFEEASGYEHEKWECTNCVVYFKVDVTNYRGTVGTEIWEELIT